MNNNAYEDHAGMLDDLQREQSSAELIATWNGNAQVAILPGGAKFQRQNEQGGFGLDCDLMLTVTTRQFGSTLPDAAQQIVYQGLNYRIRSVETMPGAYQLRLHCLFENAE